MGSNETATATTGGPRVIDVFDGNGELAHRKKKLADRKRPSEQASCAAQDGCTYVSSDPIEAPIASGNCVRARICSGPNVIATPATLATAAP